MLSIEQWYESNSGLKLKVDSLWKLLTQANRTAVFMLAHSKIGLEMIVVSNWNYKSLEVRSCLKLSLALGLFSFLLFAFPKTRDTWGIQPICLFTDFFILLDVLRIIVRCCYAAASMQISRKHALFACYVGYSRVRGPYLAYCSVSQYQIVGYWQSL